MKKCRILCALLSAVMLVSIFLLTSCELIGHEHSYGEWEVETDSTCSTLGRQVRQCQSCKKKEYEDIPYKAHNSDTWIIDKDATCTEAGEKHKRCDVCNQSYLTQAINPAHEFEGDLCKFCGVEVTKYFKFTYSDYYQTFSIAKINKTTLMPKHIILPTTYLGVPVTTVDSYAFISDLNIQSVIIPDGYTKISQGSFKGCFALNSVEIADSVTEIEMQAFEECRNLTEVNIPNNLTVIDAAVFSSCYSLAEITIPESVEIIQHGAFGGCDFVSIVIPDSVTHVYYGAFSNCTSLKNVVIGKKVKHIGAGVFGGCKLLNNVVFKKTDGWYYEIKSSTNNNDYISGTKTERVYFSIEDLSNPFRAAMYLMSKYTNKTWYRRY